MTKTNKASSQTTDSLQPVRQLRMLPVEDIRLDPSAYYRRSHGDAEALAVSIKEVGIRDPLCVSQEGYLIHGYRRWVAAKMAGLKTVPVLVVPVEDIALGRFDAFAHQELLRPSDWVAMW